MSACSTDRRLHRGGAYSGAAGSASVEIPASRTSCTTARDRGVEDKVVQKAVVDVILTPIYEVVFFGLQLHGSDRGGGRTMRSALAFGIERSNSWIVE